MHNAVRLTVLAGAAALAILAGSPALARTTRADAPPTPQDVAVAWTSAEHTTVRISWHDSEPLANKISFESREEAGGFGDPPDATEPDQYLFGASFFPHDGPWRITVVAVAEDGTLSEGAASPWFDTQAAPSPVLDEAVPRDDGRLFLRWHAGTPAPDSTPGDPLDLPPPAALFAVAVIQHDTQHIPLAPSSPATSLLVDRRAPPYRLYIKTRNEWRETWLPVQITATKLTAQAKTAGAVVSVTGSVKREFLGCDPGPCFPVPTGREANRLVTLQVRGGSTDAWTQVGQARTRSDGTFRFRLTIAGTHQYRVVTASIPAGAHSQATFAAQTDPLTITVPLDEGSGGLADTGGRTVPIALTGAGLLVLGTALILVGRRRRSLPLG